MDPKVLTALLTRHMECSQQTARDGLKFSMPSGAEVTLFVSTGEESLVVEKVRELILEADLVVATTSREERFAFLCRDLRALRATGSGRSGAGYA
jgi:hypothetical protein